MVAIALFHSFVIALVPVGVVVFIRCKGTRAGVGIAIAALGLLGVSGLTVTWPVDFLQPNRETRISLQLQGYTIEALQIPGDDFYDSYFRVTDVRGRVAMFVIDADDYKWWNPSFKKVGSRIYVSTLFDFGEPSGGSIDLEKMSLNSRVFNRSMALSELSFE